MKKYDICDLLMSNPYPGRGLITGLSEDGTGTVLLYFIMGRSINSRNRVFEKTADGIRTTAYDITKLADPSLIIYHPVRVWEGSIIATNGLQTDTILEYLQNGLDFREALYKWEFEPDPPIFTPRISGLIAPDGKYRLSILKTADFDASCCCRYFFEYSAPLPGVGHFISTYQTDGAPPPSFEGEPVMIDISVAGGLDGFAAAVWDALDSENKVSLYARKTDIATRESQEVIINMLGQ